MADRSEQKVRKGTKRLEVIAGSAAKECVKGASKGQEFQPEVPTEHTEYTEVYGDHGSSGMGTDRFLFHPR
jgi:hypothetical protein